MISVDVMTNKRNQMDIILFWRDDLQKLMRTMSWLNLRVATTQSRIVTLLQLVTVICLHKTVEPKMSENLSKKFEKRANNLKK